MKTSHLWAMWVCSGFLAAPAIAEEKDSGGVSGTIKLSGDAPAAPDLHPTMQGCPTNPIHDPGMVVDDNHRLANAVVYLAGVKTSGPVAAREVLLDQKDCRFVPHVQATTLGSKLTVKNSDTSLHTAHARSASAQTLFNVATPGGLTSQPQVLAVGGPIAFTCDAGHTWMSATIYVFDQPYFAVTDAGGAFSIPGVPAGTYTLKVWHEKLGERSAPVTIVAGKSATIEIDYKPNRK